MEIFIISINILMLVLSCAGAVISLLNALENKKDKVFMLLLSLGFLIGIFYTSKTLVSIYMSTHMMIIAK